MQVRATYKGGVEFEVEARGHKAICDQPLDNGGVDAGFTPPELLLGSLAACVGHYAVQYLNSRGLSSDLQVCVQADKALQPARLTSFHVEISAGELSDRHREGLLRAARTCLIHNTLASHPTMEIHLAPALVQLA